MKRMQGGLKQCKDFDFSINYIHYRAKTHQITYFLNIFFYVFQHFHFFPENRLNAGFFFSIGRTFRSLGRRGTRQRLGGFPRTLGLKMALKAQILPNPRTVELKMQFWTREISIGQWGLRMRGLLGPRPNYDLLGPGTLLLYLFIYIDVLR